MAKIAEKVFSIINPIVIDMGYELLGIEYVASGKHTVLRLYIDCEEGIRVDDCETVSRQVSSIMDVENPVNGQYNLEVSSPGIERPLFVVEHYQRFLGYDVRLRTYRPIDGKRNFTGCIGSVGETTNTIELITGLGPVTLDIGLIEKANLVTHF